MNEKARLNPRLFAFSRYSLRSPGGVDESARLCLDRYYVAGSTSSSWD